MNDLDVTVRLHVMRRFVADGTPPTAAAIAEELGVAVADVEDALRRLSDGHVFVLEPGSTDIWMANPLSARETAFRVHAGDRSWWGTCAWDALGVLAMVDADGLVQSSCPDCEEALEVRVESGAVRAEPAAIANFAVPAADWWADIGYT